LYGSVTPENVSAELNAAIDSYENGAMVRIDPKDVTILDLLPGDGHRVQHMGTYTIEISKPSVHKKVLRQILVQEEQAPSSNAVMEGVLAASTAQGASQIASTREA
jgi:hypothetical protein